MLYFAYGSNMDGDRMAAPRRAPNARFVCKALLPGYELRFTRCKDDGTGAADIVPQEGQQVWGVVYEMSDRDRGSLDTCEGVPVHAYRAEDVIVHPDGDLGMSRTAFTYVVCEKCAEHQRPTREYLGHILNGARLRNLPADYIARIERVETVP